MRISKKLRQLDANIPDARDTRTVAIDFHLRPDGAPADTLSPHLGIDRGSPYRSRLPKLKRSRIIFTSKLGAAASRQGFRGSRFPREFAEPRLAVARSRVHRKPH